MGEIHCLMVNKRHRKSGSVDQRELSGFSRRGDSVGRALPSLASTPTFTCAGTIAVGARPPWVLIIDHHAMDSAGVR